MTDVYSQKGGGFGHRYAHEEATMWIWKWSSTNQGERPGTAPSLTLLIPCHWPSSFPDCETINVGGWSLPACRSLLLQPSQTMYLPWGCRGVEWILCVVRLLIYGWIAAHAADYGSIVWISPFFSWANCISHLQGQLCVARSRSSGQQTVIRCILWPLPAAFLRSSWQLFSFSVSLLPSWWLECRPAGGI